jgi:hypothetical protein
VENTVHSRGFRGPRGPHLARMVNDRFRAASIYGFEMVDAAAARTFRHQSNIYAESNRSDFSRIFRAFTSTQTLAVYRALLVRR